MFTGHERLRSRRSDLQFSIDDLRKSPDSPRAPRGGPGALNAGAHIAERRARAGRCRACLRGILVGNRVDALGDRFEVIGRDIRKLTEDVHGGSQVVSLLITKTNSEVSE